MSVLTASFRPILLPSLGAGQAMGYLAMTATVFVWAAFALSTRMSDGAALAFADIALIRSLVPTLVFLPFLPARMGMIRRAGLRNCAIIAVGAGLPFFWLAVAGAAATSAAHVAALVAGTVPVSVALLLWLRHGERPSALGSLALVLILGGVALMVGPISGQAVIGGVAALLLASLCWGAFTLAVKRSGLDPLGCALVISLPSTVAIGVLLATGLAPTHWGAFTLAEAMPFILVQGILVSVLAVATYAFAIARLGSARCAALGSATPALAALMAIPVLQEQPDLGTWIAICVICIGVALSARASRGVV
ncbi:DMT family transporter [Dinoroseobacter sp. S76]|uniref:DMT family transporter n=1 Tax=Dinoroseobacter sp. S76 TaxID=3415124 RepID=UPI003C7E8A26